MGLDDLSTRQKRGVRRGNPGSKKFLGEDSAQEVYNCVLSMVPWHTMWKGVEQSHDPTVGFHCCCWFHGSTVQQHMVNGLLKTSAMGQRCVEHDSMAHNGRRRQQRITRYYMLLLYVQLKNMHPACMSWYCQYCQSLSITRFHWLK